MLSVTSTCTSSAARYPGWLSEGGLLQPGSHSGGLPFNCRQYREDADYLGVYFKAKCIEPDKQSRATHPLPSEVGSCFL